MVNRMSLVAYLISFSATKEWDKKLCIVMAPWPVGHFAHEGMGEWKEMPSK